jgi:hypothetical protein
MTHGMRTRVDMRAFPWKLGMLERKLEHAADLARASLATAQCEAQALAAAVQVLQQEKAAQLHCSSAAGQRIDPAAQARLLQFLAQAEGRLAARHLELARLGDRIAAARQDCAAADLELARVCKLRESAEAAYAGEQLRREGKEADLAWIALAACRRTGLVERTRPANED